MLTAAELARYGRQLVLPELGLAGQERLRRASALVVGAGGLGSPAALYLAASGIGTLGLVDDDVVEVSNLHRQVLHGTADVGRNKTDSAADMLRRLNPHVELRLYRERLTKFNAKRIVAPYDIVVDGSDNYATRYAVNDACAARRVAWVYGSVERYSGQVAVFGADGPCYRCLFPEAPAPGTSPSCEEIGVLGAVPGVIGAMQALEALKSITGIGEPLRGKLLQIDFLAGQTRTIRFDRRSDCPACGGRESEDRARPAAGESDEPDASPIEIEPAEAARLLSSASRPLLLDVREPWEMSRAQLGESTAIPMRELEDRIGAIDRARELIVYCHHGTRSRMVSEWLRSLGYRARNLSGGIDRWSREIDHSIPRY